MVGGGITIVTGDSVVGPGVSPGENRTSIDGSVDPVGSLAEMAGAVHLAEEEELVDLAEGPARVADLDPGQPGGEVGRLVRRQSPADQAAVRRPGWELRRRLRADRRARGGGGRPRLAHGGRRERRPRVDARRSPPTLYPATRLACHGSPCRPGPLGWFRNPAAGRWFDRSVRPGRRSPDPEISGGVNGMFSRGFAAHDDPSVRGAPVLSAGDLAGPTRASRNRPVTAGD